MSASAIAAVAFEGTTVRTAIIDGEPWFCAQDVGLCLGMTKSATRTALADLYNEDKVVRLTDTPGGRQPLKFTSESGVYGMILQSRKRAARRFHRWLTREVLPSIARTGRYEIAPQDPAAVIAAGWKMLAAQVETERAGRLAAEATAAGLAETIEEQEPAVALEAAFSAWQWALDAEGLTVSVADDDQTGIKAPVARFQDS